MTTPTGYICVYVFCLRTVGVTTDSHVCLYPLCASRGVLESMCDLYRSRGLPPLVRVPKADAVLARAVIDAGALGVIASYMEVKRRWMRD